MNLSEEQVQESVKNQIENVEYDVLTFMVQNMNRQGVSANNNARKPETMQKNNVFDIFTKDGHQSGLYSYICQKEKNRNFHGKQRIRKTSLFMH